MKHCSPSFCSMVSIGQAGTLLYKVQPSWEIPNPNGPSPRPGGACRRAYGREKVLSMWGFEKGDKEERAGPGGPRDGLRGLTFQGQKGPHSPGPLFSISAA